MQDRWGYYTPKSKYKRMHENESLRTVPSSEKSKRRVVLTDLSLNKDMATMLIPQKPNYSKV